MSDLISIVLLLAFTLAVAFMLGTWITDLSRSTNDRNQESLKGVDCNYADFEIDEDHSRYANGTSGYVFFGLLNKGSVSLYNFTVFSIGSGFVQELTLENPLNSSSPLMPGEIISFNATGNVNGTKFMVFSRFCPSVSVEFEP